MVADKAGEEAERGTTEGKSSQHHQVSAREKICLQSQRSFVTLQENCRINSRTVDISVKTGTVYLKISCCSFLLFALVYVDLDCFQVIFNFLWTSNGITCDSELSQ